VHQVNVGLHFLDFDIGPCPQRDNYHGHNDGREGLFHNNGHAALIIIIIRKAYINKMHEPLIRSESAEGWPTYDLDH
jgi:hypothetical protein